jgi:hypothetical protein
VWKWICSSLGLASFLAAFFLEAQKVPLKELRVAFPKTLFDFLVNHHVVLPLLVYIMSVENIILWLI